MYEEIVKLSGFGKHYIEVKSGTLCTCEIKIEANGGVEHFCILLQSRKAYFVSRSTISSYFVCFRAASPLQVKVLTFRNKRPVRLKLLELIDDYRRKREALWPILQTENGVHLREITFGRFMPNAKSDAERKLFHQLKLRESFELANADKADENIIFSDQPLRDLISFAAKQSKGEFLFVAQADMFKPEHRRIVSRFVRERFGEPATESGPAWQLMRDNPKLGFVGWGTGGSLRKIRGGDRASRRLRALLNIYGAGHRTPTDLPALFLVRKGALKWLTAINVDTSDLGKAMFSSELLLPLIPVLCEKAGFMVAALPDLDGDRLIGGPVDRAKWSDFRLPGQFQDREICLFVGLIGRDGKLSAHALDYMRALKRNGLYVYLLGASLGDPDQVNDPGPEFCDAFAARANDGHDFAIWAAAIKRVPQIWQAKSLLLANDSVVVSSSLLDVALRRLQNSAYDVTGATESPIGGCHLQSYFIHLNRKALEKSEVRRFWDAVLSWKDKSRIITLYEIGMTSKFVSAGLTCGALYMVGRAPADPNYNPAIHSWKDLIKSGSPFLKVQVVRDLMRNNEWNTHAAFLGERGFKCTTLERQFSGEAG